VAGVKNWGQKHLVWGGKEKKNSTEGEKTFNSWWLREMEKRKGHFENSGERGRGNDPQKVN